MAYPPAFEFDIFISYAHVDNLPGGKRGWVHRFQKELVDRLDKRLGRVGAARVWWDDGLDGSQVFDRKIEDVVNRSSLFLALTSEGYLKSEYCNKELECFCRKAEQESAGLIVGNRARVLNVLLDDIHYDRWPARYGGTSGYPFFDAEEGNPLDVTRKPFNVEINRMVKVICEMLEALGGDGRNGAPPPPPPPPFTVFVADTATTLKTVRSRVYSELVREGVRVTDLIPPPRAAAEHDEEAVEKIKAADLCVHLLDHVPGREIDDRPEQSYLERQAELSLEHARSQLVWVPTELTPPRVEEVEDGAHKALLRRLSDGPRREGADYKFIRTLSSAISQDILGQIEQVKKRREAAATAATQGGARTALIDIHLKDWQYALSLSRSLLERQIVPSVNREEDSPQKNLKGFEDQLRRADLLIIVFGDVPQEWVRERLGEALKIVAVSPQDCALRACGVYLAPPHKKEEEARFRHPLLPIEIMDNSERFNPQTLDLLLSKIQVGA
jgi:hypothetical protein